MARALHTHTHHIVHSLMGIFLPFNGIKKRSRAERELGGSRNVKRNSCNLFQLQFN